MDDIINRYLEYLYVPGNLRAYSFNEIKECIEKEHADAKRVLIVLGKVYKRKKDTLVRETANYIMEILTMIAKWAVRPVGFVNSSELREILLDIYATGRFEGHDKINPQYVFRIFRYLSDAISATQPVLELERTSDLLVTSFLPESDHQPISAAQALCLHALLFTHYWKRCKDKYKHMVYSCVVHCLETKECESRHLEFLASMVKDHGVKNHDKLLMYMKPILELSKETFDADLCIQTCRLLVLLLTKMKGMPQDLRSKVDLRSLELVLHDCVFSNLFRVRDSVNCAKLTTILIIEMEHLLNEGVAALPKITDYIKKHCYYVCSPLLYILAEYYQMEKDNLELDSAKSFLEILLFIAQHTTNIMLVMSNKLPELLLDIFSPNRYGNVIEYHKYIFDIFRCFSDGILRVQCVSVLGLERVSQKVVTGFLRKADGGRNLSRAQVLCLQALFLSKFGEWCPEEVKKMVYWSLLNCLQRKDCESRHLELVIQMTKNPTVQVPEMLLFAAFKSMRPVLELAVETRDEKLGIRACTLFSLLYMTNCVILKFKGKKNELKPLQSILKECRYGRGSTFYAAVAWAEGAVTSMMEVDTTDTPTD